MFYHLLTMNKVMLSNTFQRTWTANVYYKEMLIILLLQFCGFRGPWRGCPHVAPLTPQKWLDRRPCKWIVLRPNVITNKKNAAPAV